MAIGTPKNHFNWINKATGQIGFWARYIRKQSPVLFKIIQAIGFVLVGIATWLIERVCEKGGTVTLVLALVAIAFFVGIFAFDYSSAKRINHQFFWKPWILIFVLLIVVGISGYRSGNQKETAQTAMENTNNFYAKQIENTNDYYAERIKTISDETNNLTAKINETMGEFEGAKHDRDHYQEMLAPFEAMALAKYTNAPVEQSIAMLAETMGIITNAILNNKPVLELELNGIKIPYADPTPGNDVSQPEWR